MRHTKSQERSGKKLCKLPPERLETVAVALTSSERRQYQLARVQAASRFQSARAHAHAHALWPLLAQCSGLVGELRAGWEARTRGPSTPKHPFLRPATLPALPVYRCTVEPN